MRNELINAWRRASTAELLWETPNGPRGTPVVPLIWPQDRLPCVAIPLDQLGEIESLAGPGIGEGLGGRTGPDPGPDPGPDTGTAATGTVTLSVQTDAETPSTVSATGPVRVEWDLTGERFIDHLLPQEVAKHPPTRLRSDSLMARRENWWWLPRALVTLTDTTRVCSLPARRSADDALLVRGTRTDSASSHGPSLRVVTATHWPRPGGRDPVEACSGDGAPLDGDDDPVYVFGHRHSPDFERWERWTRVGTLRGQRLHLTAGDGGPRAGDEHAGTAAPFTLVQRVLNHRRTARACKAGIAEAERRHT